ncbi:hypothetical protein ES708_07580 [subsurface metagenome]
MKGKMLIVGVILALVVSVLPMAAACGPEEPLINGEEPPPTNGEEPPPPADQIVWTFATCSGGSPWHWGFVPDPIFQTMLEEMTGGRLILDTKIDLIPSAELIMGVIDGRVDIGTQRLPWCSGTFPQFDFGSLPFYFMDVMEYYETVTDPDMIELLDREYEAVGLVRIAEIAAGPENGIWGSKPVANIEDFEGLKIRTSGVLQTNTLMALGAAPLTMPLAELSDAIYRGTVDAVATSPGFGLGRGLADVCDYISIWPVTSNFPCALVVNKDKFYDLPSDLQEIVREWGRMITRANVYGQQCHYITARYAIVSAGVNVVVPDRAEIEKARALSQSSIDKWLELTGPVGEEILAIAARHASGGQ